MNLSTASVDKLVDKLLLSALKPYFPKADDELINYYSQQLLFIN